MATTLLDANQAAHTARDAGADHLDKQTLRTIWRAATGERLPEARPTTPARPAIWLTKPAPSSPDSTATKT